MDGRILKNTIATEKPLIGLKDGGKTVIICSGCRKPLMVVWVTRPNEKIANKVIEWKICAQCCYCKDKSYEKIVKGGFHHAGYGLVNKDDPEMDTPVTVIEEIDTDRENNRVVFKIKKV